MLTEGFNPGYVDYIIKNLSPNPETPYKREITEVRWMSPQELPFVFHTAAEAFNAVDLAKCESFDYCVGGILLPVSYVLPYPHVNRVRGYSEIWSAQRKEAQDRHGYSHCYLTIGDKRDPTNKPIAQVRLGSTMEDMYLLALSNSGGVFKVSCIAEGGVKLVELISISSLPVVDAFRFDNPSPNGFATGGRRETHTQLPIPHPDMVGYARLENTIHQFSTPHQRVLTEIANGLLERPFSGQVPFPRLVEANRLARFQFQNQALPYQPAPLSKVL